MNLSVAGQAHHMAPARPADKPGQEFIAGKGSIRQQGDRSESAQEPLGPLQQSAGYSCALTLTLR